MKKINTVVLNTRNRELTSLIQNSIFLENLYNDGKTAEVLIGEAKEVLGLTDGDSVEASYEDIVKLINKKTDLLLKINTALSTAKELGFEGSLEDIHNQLLEEISAKYKVETSDLLSE